jgi:hypothetical protein
MTASAREHGDAGALDELLQRGGMLLEHGQAAALFPDGG